MRRQHEYKNMSFKTCALYALCAIFFWGTVSTFAYANDHEGQMGLTPIEKVRNIAEIYSQDPTAKNLLVINYADISAPYTRVGPGVHYTIVVTKFGDTLTEEDRKIVQATVSMLLKAATALILSDNEVIEYIAIQVLPPNLWPQGFGDLIQQGALLFVAKRDELMALLEMQDEKFDWSKVAQQGPLELVDTYILKDLMESYFNSKKEDTGKDSIR